MTLLRLAAAHICAVLPYSSLRLEGVKPNLNQSLEAISVWHDRAEPNKRPTDNTTAHLSYEKAPKIRMRSHTTDRKPATSNVLFAAVSTTSKPIKQEHFDR